VTGSSIIEVKDLTRRFGALTAVHRLNLEVAPGEIFGLVGPDGAGKTTTLRLMCGLMAPDQGQVLIAGQDAARETDAVRDHIGYMAQRFGLYSDLTVDENMYFYADLFGITKRDRDELLPGLLQMTRMAPFRKRQAGRLSGGMKQKLALSCALVHDPKVLMLDEPTTGVDPLSRRQFWDILKELRKSGSTIIVSTPYMDEVALSDRAIFIYGGKKLAEGTPAELPRLFTGKAYAAATAPTFETMEKLRGIRGLQSRRFGSSIHIYTGASDTLGN